MCYVFFLSIVFDNYYNNPAGYIDYAASYVPGYKSMPGFFIPSVIKYPSSDFDPDTYSTGRLIGGNFFFTLSTSNSVHSKLNEMLAPPCQIGSRISRLTSSQLY